MKRYLYILLSVLFCALSAMTVQRRLIAAPEVKSHSHLSKEQAVALARKIAEEKGYSLMDFSLPNANYQVLNGKGLWTVHFQRKKLRPDGRFVVFIDDITGHPDLVPEQ